MTPSTEQLKKVTEHMTKTVEGMHSMTSDFMNVMMKSTAAMTKGMDESMRNATAMMQENIARAMSMGKTVMNAKSPREAMDMQVEHLKESFDHMIASSSRMTEMSARIFKDTIEPVAQHANNAVSKMMEKTRVAA